MLQNSRNKGHTYCITNKSSVNQPSTHYASAEWLLNLLGPLLFHPRKKKNAMLGYMMIDDQPFDS